MILPNIALLFVISAGAAQIPPWATEFLKLTNDARSKVGAQKLCLNEKLNEAATRYSKYLKTIGKITHDGPPGQKNIVERAKGCGFQFQALGENLATAYGNVAAKAFQSLMNSPGHRKNIVNPKFNMMGIGGLDMGPVHKGDWVQFFAKSNVEKCCSGTFGSETGAQASASASASAKAQTGSPGTPAPAPSPKVAPELSPAPAPAQAPDAPAPVPAPAPTQAPVPAPPGACPVPGTGNPAQPTQPGGCKGRRRCKCGNRKCKCRRRRRHRRLQALQLAAQVNPQVVANANAQAAACANAK